MELLLNCIYKENLSNHQSVVVDVDLLISWITSLMIYLLFMTARSKIVWLGIRIMCLMYC